MNIKIEYYSNKEINLIESRPFLFFDGINRIISLEKREWRKLDLAVEHGGNDALVTVLEIAYQLAEEFHDPEGQSFEADIRQAMPMAIWAEVDAMRKDNFSIDQDDQASHTS